MERKGHGSRASSAAQPVRFDASKLHTLQALVLQFQVISTLEEVAVTWGREEREAMTTLS
jgi:hypothetical protein